jgi:RNA polymerase sigma-70 factor (ECF subfamily)
MKCFFALGAPDQNGDMGHSTIEPNIYGDGRQTEVRTPARKTVLRRGPGRKGQQASGKDDSLLIDRLKAGDPEALRSIFDLYAAKLYGLAHRIVGNASDSEEVIQDVFWNVYRKAETFRGTAQFSTWLYRLTVNAALGKIRRSKRNREVEYEEFLPKFRKDGHHRVRPVVDWSNSLDEHYARQEMEGLVNHALGELKPLDKSVIVLSELEGLPDKEIAAVLGLTVSAVKTRLHRARLFLRGKLAVHFGHSAA